MIKALFLILLLAIPARADDFTVRIVETQDNGRTRYDLHRGDGHFHSFYSGAEFSDWANRTDTQDDNKTLLLRLLFRRLLQTRTPAQILTALRNNPEGYSISLDVTVTPR